MEDLWLEAFLGSFLQLKLWDHNWVFKNRKLGFLHKWKLILQFSFQNTVNTVKKWQKVGSGVVNHVYTLRLRDHMTSNRSKSVAVLRSMFSVVGTWTFFSSTGTTTFHVVSPRVHGGGMMLFWEVLLQVYNMSPYKNLWSFTMQILKFHWGW